MGTVIAMEYKRRSEILNDGKTVMPGAGPVVVGQPGKNMRKSRRQTIYEADKTALVNGVPTLVPGATILVEREEDLPGYRAPGPTGRYDHGWELVRTNVSVDESKVHRPGDGKVHRKERHAAPLQPTTRAVKRTRANA